MKYNYNKIYKTQQYDEIDITMIKIKSPFIKRKIILHLIYQKLKKYHL